VLQQNAGPGEAGRDFDHKGNMSAGRLLRGLRVCIAALGVWLHADAGSVEVPAGIYALSPARQPVPEAVLSHPAAVGVVLRGEWADVEPSEGHYDWRHFDEQMKRVAQAGKAASLVITSGGRAVPDWLSPRLGERLRFTDTVRFHQSHGHEIEIPVFWDPALVEHKKRLIAALGERFADRPELRLVSVQCANATTDDWNIPGGEKAVAAWRHLGFSEARLLEVCKSLIDATAQAFPAQALRMALGRVPPGLSSDADAVARELIRYASTRYPGRFYAQRHNLSARTPGPRDARASGWRLIAEACPACAAQYLWPASDTRSCRLNGGQRPCDTVSMFREAADTARAYGLRYVEVYGADLQRPALVAEVERLARGLGAGAHTGRMVAVGEPVSERRPKRREQAGPLAEAVGVQYLAFPSKAYGGNRNYAIWLPDSYASGQRRYPVLYWLHGKGGDPRRSAHISKYLQRAIAEGRMPETILVFPDGDTDRFYTDGPDGRSPVETMIIDELIPYIDSTYRTVGDRRGRMIEGFSMGGFGALKFAAKFPELFVSVVAYGAPRLDASLGMRGQDAGIYEDVFAGDPERFRRNTPSWLFGTNKEKVLAAGLRIRLVAGSKDGTRSSVQTLHQVLGELGIPHEYELLPDVRHVPAMYYEEDRGKGFVLHAEAVGHR
jgi:enterochelin esterase-like enzyme